jgi:hypothetical protein
VKKYFNLIFFLAPFFLQAITGCLVLLSGGNLTTQEWCEEYGLTAAINVGMFDTDHLTYVGFCSNHGHVNNGGVNKYPSVAAFGPE